MNKYDKMQESLLKAIRHQTYCKIAPSKIHGVGVFAIKHIPINIDPFKEYPQGSETIFKVEHDLLKDIDPTLKKYIYQMYVNDPEYIYLENISPNNLPIYYRMNHSNDPNIAWDHKKRSFKSVKDINVEEQLLLDYDKY